MLRNKEDRILVKLFRLTLVGVLTAAVCILYFYLFENETLYQTCRCLRAAPHWYSCYSTKQLKEFDFTTDFYGMQYEGNVKNGIDREVLFFGAYEKPILFFLRDVMKLIYSNQGVFLDVGANVGQHSLFMSRYAKEVHSFEPYEPVLQRFRRMIEINQIQNVRIYPVGLGNKNTKIPFFKPPDTNLGAGSFVEGFNPENASYKELEIVVGDEALEKAKVSSVGLIKIDVEGYEKPVLQGLNRTLTTNRPIIVFELTITQINSSRFRSKEDILSVFPSGYDFLVFREPYEKYTGSYQLVEIEQQVRFDVPSQNDIVAYPIERKSQIPRKNL